jgi:hypothetical protein
MTKPYMLSVLYADREGQSTLPSSCPVCEHTPVAAEDCKPNKSLRTTIKVFLRTEEKKREALRLKDLKNTPPDTPVTPVTPIDALAASTLPLESAPTLAPDAKDEAPQPPSVEPSTAGDLDGQVPATEPIAAELPTEDQQDIPQPSIEVHTDTHPLFLPMLTMFRKLHLAKNQQKKAARLPTKLE